MIDQDRTLLESTSTHRQRLASAFVYGEQDQRRRINNNVGRFIGSVILAAVACAAVLGTGFVLNILQNQRETRAIESYQAAIAASPLQASELLLADPDSGYLIDTRTGEVIDPRTGYVIDLDTGFATDFSGRLVDPRTGWFVDPRTGYRTDPKSGVTIDPGTLTIVNED